MSNIVRTAETSLDVADLRRAFKVVEEVTAADNIHSFREAVVNALGQHLGFRDASQCHHLEFLLCRDDGIGRLDDAALTPRDVEMMRMLSRTLANLLSLYARIPVRQAPEVLLSRRQAEVADLVAQGLTNHQIARTLHVGVDTVKKHLTAALKATGCASRTQLALHWASQTRR